MATISVCMIVKNEEAVLSRCLDCLYDIADEIVIVDTGSTDRTKEIAAGYTNRIYDFAWEHDFSAARNYACSLATMEYIYSADADEVLTQENRLRLKQLKQAILPEIEMVQMIYVNPAESNTVYNYTRELRPKLFRRLRTLRWTDPIHETVATEPLVYDSDIEILHLPQGNHAGRDFAAMEGILSRGEAMSSRLYSMYAKELYISGEEADFLRAEPYFQRRILEESCTPEERKEALCVLAKAAMLKRDVKELYALCLTELAGGQKLPAELAFLLGEAMELEQREEAAISWYQTAAFETENYVCIFYGGAEALRRIIRILEKNGKHDAAMQYRNYLVQLEQT